jgi:hypothetical protein
LSRWDQLQNQRQQAGLPPLDRCGQARSLGCRVERLQMALQMRAALNLRSFDVAPEGIAFEPADQRPTPEARLAEGARGVDRGAEPGRSTPLTRRDAPRFESAPVGTSIGLVAMPRKSAPPAAASAGAQAVQRNTTIADAAAMAVIRALTPSLLSQGS